MSTFRTEANIWSGRRDLNPRLRPWQGRTLPLSYSRSDDGIINYAAEGLTARLSVPGVPLRVFFRRHDLAIAHVNDVVAVCRRFRIVRNHQHRLAQFLV